MSFCDQTRAVAYDLVCAAEEVQRWSRAGFSATDGKGKTEGSLVQIVGTIVALVGAAYILRGIAHHSPAGLAAGGIIWVSGHDILQIGRTMFHMNDPTLKNAVSSAKAEAKAASSGLWNGCKALFKGKDAEKAYRRKADESKIQSDLERLTHNTLVLKYFVRLA